MIRKLGDWHVDDQEIAAVRKPEHIDGLDPKCSYLTILLHGGGHIYVDGTAGELQALHAELVSYLAGRHEEEAPF